MIFGDPEIEAISALGLTAVISRVMSLVPPFSKVFQLISRVIKGFVIKDEKQEKGQE